MTPPFLSQPELGSSRRRNTMAYKGGTVIVELGISEGSPSKTTVFNDLQKMVMDINTAWYQVSFHHRREGGGAGSYADQIVCHVG